MKKFLTISITILLICQNGLAIIQVYQPSQFIKKDSEDTLGQGLKRGTINILSGWLEIPRCISVESSCRLITMPILGPLIGSSFTAIRTLSGVIDILSIGYFGRYKYSTTVPDYFWESPWTSTNKYNNFD